MNKLFDIVTLSDSNNYNGARLGQIDTVVSVIEGIINIFSGGGESGLPGDYDNRVRQAHRWAVNLGVVDCVDLNKVERLITQPGVWQARTQQYMYQLLGQKNKTGSCQSVIGTPGGLFGGGGGGASIFPPGSNLPLLLLGGGALFLIMNAKKKPRRR